MNLECAGKAERRRRFGLNENGKRCRAALATALQMIQQSSSQFDLIIIGAGINGAGIARDAARRGLKVLMLDKGDVCSGTSSWSTRLIHGGLRYLEYGEFGLVRESLRERETLLRIAPHLVRPLPLVVPIYKHSSRGPLTMRAGMLAYDVLSAGKSLPRHKMLSRSQALEQLPGLNPDGLKGAAEYYDAQVEFAERLVVENALAAIRHGASVITHARVDRFLFDGNAVRGVEFINEIAGERHVASGSLVINAAGPWVDRVLEKNANAPRLIGGTKGSHIIVAPFPSAPLKAIYVEAQADRRPFFIIPWNSNYLIGTTDLRYDGDLDRIQIEQTEIEYLLRETNLLLPEARLKPDNILYSYAGVRPLPYTDDKAERSITRRHFIQPHPRFGNLFSIVGGKLTTYRSLAEEAVDLVFEKLGRTSPDCVTATEPLVEINPALVSPNGSNATLSSKTMERLKQIYGGRANEILKVAADDPSLGEVFDGETGAIAAEVVYSFRREFAQTLADCLLRRTMVGLNSSLGVGADEAAARIGQKHLGWSEDRGQGEVRSYREFIERFRV